MPIAVGANEFMIRTASYALILSVAYCINSALFCRVYIANSRTIHFRYFSQDVFVLPNGCADLRSILPVNSAHLQPAG